MLLTVHRGQVVGVDRIVDALWDDRPPRQPEQNVATLVSRLRAVLGSEVITGGRGGYRLGVPPAVRVDVDAAAELVTEGARRLAGGEAAVAVSAASRALEMLGTGSLLVGEAEVDWVLAARADAECLVREARHTAAAAALLIDDPYTAVQASRAAIAADPFDEPAHRFLMAAHVAAGEPPKALAVYEVLRAGLGVELGVDPALETRAMHLAVLRERQPGNVVPALAKQGPRGPGRAVLPGRVKEVAQLYAAWAAAVDGEPGALLITGEAGIGKTRLAAELVAVAESTGGMVLQARCYAAEHSLFLQPVVDALAGPLATMRPERLRELPGARAAAFAGLLPGVADVFGPVAMERAGPEVELRRAFDAMSTMLVALTRRRPALLVLDDLQNAGEATVEFLHYIRRHCDRARLLVVSTIRAEEGQSAIDTLVDVADRVELGPLPVDAIAQLATEAGHGDLTDAIARRTRGHALFVAETLRALSAGESGVPQSLQASVLTRLRRAGPEIEELLRAGAVLGASVDPIVVGGLLGVPPHIAARRCEQAASTRLLVVAGRNYEFANDLVQEALYATTPTPTRIAYHRRAADLLADHPELVAAHAVAADDWPRASRAYLLAGENALHRYATRDAESLLGKALHAAERTGQSDLIGRVYLARSRVCTTMGSYPLAWADVRAGLEAARQAGDRRLEMVLLFEHGRDAAAALGVEIAEVSANLRAASSIAESLGDRATQAAVLARLAIISVGRLHFTEAISLGRRAVEEGRTSGDNHALASGLDGLKTAYAYIGDMQPLSLVLAELEPLQRRLGDLSGLEWAVFESSFLPMATGDWNQARARIGEAIEINRRSEYIAGRACYVAHLGWLDRLQGRTEQSVRNGRLAVNLAERTTHGWWHSMAIGMLAASLLELGQREEAGKVLGKGLKAERSGQLEAYLVRYLATMAEVAASRQVVEEAEAMLLAVSAPPDSAWLLGTDCYLAVARAWLDLEQPQRARDVLVPLLAAAERQGWVSALAGGLLVDGRACMELRDRVTGISLLKRAAAIAASRGMPVIERSARTYLAKCGR